MFLRSLSVFIFGSICLAYFSSTFADAKSDLVVKDSGLECRLPLVQPWQKMPTFFGFSSLLYQESANEARAADDENPGRVTFGLVITPFEGQAFKDENPEKEIAKFHQAKKEFIEEHGGRYIASAPSLLGKDAHQTFRASVDYEHDGVEYRDSTYFRFVNGRLVHAKVIFPLKVFSEKTVEEQTTQLLAGMSCSSAK